MNNIAKCLHVVCKKTPIRIRLSSNIAATNVVTDWKRKFEEEKVEEPDFSIKCIMSHVLNINFSTLESYRNTSLTAEQKDAFDRLCECRISRMPIQYIVGSWEFRNHLLRMVPPVFIPRPETEQLVDLVLENLIGSVEFLEVGCGSGAISCSLLSEQTKARGTAIDCSRLACNLTKYNSQELNVDDRITIIEHKVTEERLLPDQANRQFDCIVSNPPYVKTGDIVNLSPEIKLYEDLRALDGGPDGLRVIRLLCRIAERNLKCKGKTWLEVDSEQISDIKRIVENDFQSSLKILNSYKDLFGKDRFVEIERL